MRSMLRHRRILFLLAACSLIWPSVRADVVELEPVRDNTLFESPDGALSSGAGAYLYVGRTGGGPATIRRALIAFDIAGNIPAGSTVLSATVQLNMSRTNAGPKDIGLHRALADWGEGASVASGGGGAPALPLDVTWLHTFFDDQFWTIPGGDYEPAASASASVDGEAFYTWGPTQALTADVQQWLDQPDAAYGWMLIGDETANGTSKRFDAREIEDATSRPRLVVEFAPPCDPDPRGPGYWGRQCRFDAPAGAGGSQEPGLFDELLPCADAWLLEHGFEFNACEGLDLRPRRNPCNRAKRRLSTLVLNVCAGRLQTSCPANPPWRACSAENLGELLEEMTDLIQSRRCIRGLRCASGGAGGGAD